MQSSTFVLVPGMCHGGWVWHPVAQRLQAAGHRTVALTMPGLAFGDDPVGLRLKDAVNYIVAEIERRNLTDVVLVGHSWGGLPITVVAHHLSGRVAKVVYFSAIVPGQGLSAIDENPPHFADYMRAAIEASTDRTIPVSFDAFQQFMMQGEPESVQRLVFDLLTPQPGGYMMDAVEVPGVETVAIPTAYVLAEDDLSLPRPGTEYAARIGVTPVMVPGTHEALLTHPDEVAKALLSA
jgi:pimeloyl-ACP methyl ester carboxylesterase